MSPLRGRILIRLSTSQAQPTDNPDSRRSKGVGRAGEGVCVGAAGGVSAVRRDAVVGARIREAQFCGFREEGMGKEVSVPGLFGGAHDEAGKPLVAVPVFAVCDFAVHGEPGCIRDVAMEPGEAEPAVLVSRFGEAVVEAHEHAIARCWGHPEAYSDIGNSREPCNSKRTDASVRGSPPCFCGDGAPVRE